MSTLELVVIVSHELTIFTIYGIEEERSRKDGLKYKIDIIMQWNKRINKY
jgi:hypothetical protein